MSEKELENTLEAAVPAVVTTPAPGDFDWEGTGKKFGGYSKDDRKRMEEMYSGTLNQIVANEIVKATVVGITDRDVVLNIGFKSDGLVPLSEFRDITGLKVGDEVEVLIVNQEDKNGQLVLSRKAARIMNAWEMIVKSNEEDLVIEGRVKARTKGGLVVDVQGIETFLPGSQIDVKPVRDYDQYVGKTMEFKVVKINPTLRNAVVSHKVLIEDDLEAQKVEIMSKMEKGQVLEGTVKNMTDFGVFVDLGGVDGLLHITDISWGRINHPSEVLSLDQKIQVVVIDFDDEKKRISLGMKQLTSHPWDALTEAIVAGTVVKGRVVTVADYGAFLEVAAGVEGLIHVSEMSWSQHLRNPQDFMKQGDEVEAVVLSIDRDERKMSLGIKQLTADPWTDITTKFPVGSKHRGIVRNLTNFGLFVELGEGVDGLVHVSDLSWTKKINHPAEFIKRDEEIDVVVLDIDVENRRLSLGHKQLEENPWDTFETIFLEGSAHKGTITALEDKGAVVQLPYGVEGFAPKKQLQKEDGKQLMADMEAEFKVIEFSKENRRIVVSHTRTWQEAKESEKAAEQAEIANFNKKAKKAKGEDDRDTLGDLDVLAGLKAQILESEKEAQQEAIKKMDAKAKKSSSKKAKSEDDEDEEA
ncbi:MAG: 30S ribosomal protein S1 [Sphingobacteriaceae bacterium]|nr:30S ribosomal protein S1 [Sphingobacteriaceae bacterium]